MAVITTGNHPKALWPGIRKWWGNRYDEFPLQYPDLFEQQTSEKAYEEDVQSTGFGIAPVKEQGASVTYDEDLQGQTKRYTHVNYALGYIVTEEELADNLYTEVSMRRAANNAFSLRQTKEIVCAQVYNRAFTSGYTGADGTILCNSAHPSRAGNWSNVLSVAADLSEASLEDMLIQIMGATNDRGLRISIQGQSLIVPRQLVFEATRILKSTLQNDTANNAVNAMRVMGVLPGGVKVNQYLTDPDAWFVRTNCPNGMLLFNRANKPLSQDNDFDTSNAKAKASFRMSVGWTDPRGLYGSPGA